MITIERSCRGMITINIDDLPFCIVSKCFNEIRLNFKLSLPSMMEKMYFEEDRYNHNRRIEEHSHEVQESAWVACESVEDAMDQIRELMERMDIPRDDLYHDIRLIEMEIESLEKETS